MKNKMKPILFSTEMVKAILNKQKTQTRRIIKNNSKKPKAIPGEIFWVRETWQNTHFLGFPPEDFGYIYKASKDGKLWEENIAGWKWKPSIYMPKAACRIFLEVKGVRIESITDINDVDAIREGIPNGAYSVSPVSSFKKLWKSINGEKSWNKDTLVWVYDFDLIKKPCECVF